MNIIIKQFTLYSIEHLRGSQAIDTLTLNSLEPDDLEYYYLVEKDGLPVGYIKVEEIEAFDYYQHVPISTLNNSIYLAYISLSQRGLLKNILSEIKKKFQVANICAEASTDLIPLWEHSGAVFFKEATNSKHMSYVTYEHRDDMHPFII